MEKQDIELLKECSSGCEMAVKSIEQVMEYTEDDKLYQLLDNYDKKHKELDEEITNILHEDGESSKEPGIMATAMAWANIELKMLVEMDNHQIAKIMMDGCNMGIQKISEVINKYKNTDTGAEKLAKKLVKIEEDFMEDLKAYI